MSETLGMKLKRLREYQRLRQEQVAEMLGVGKSAVSMYENDTRQPSNEILLRYASIYRTTTDYLLGRDNEMMIDVTGLTEHDIRILSNLVDDIADKNKKLGIGLHNGKDE